MISLGFVTEIFTFRDLWICWLFLLHQCFLDIKKRLRKIEHLHQKGTFSWDPYFSLHLKCFILNTSVYKTSQLPNNPHMPQKLPEIPSNNISIQSGVELYKEIRASFLEAKRFLLLFCSRYNAFSVYKVLLTKSFGGFFFKCDVLAIALLRIQNSSSFSFI